VKAINIPYGSILQIVMDAHGRVESSSMAVWYAMGEQRELKHTCQARSCCMRVVPSFSISGLVRKAGRGFLEIREVRICVDGKPWSRLNNKVRISREGGGRGEGRVVWVMVALKQSGGLRR
jgi:hypothetical protein